MTTVPLLDPSPAVRAARKRGRPRLRAVPSDPPLTVTISLAGGHPADRDRLLAALGDLVSTSGATVAVPHRPARTGETRPRFALRLEPEPRAAFQNDRLLDLSRLEYDLLLFFATHPRHVFSRSQLLAQVWGHIHTGVRTVDVHISRLRRKLDDPDLIATVYGIGYRLADDAPVTVV